MLLLTVLFPFPFIFLEGFWRKKKKGGGVGGRLLVNIHVAHF